MGKSKVILLFLALISFQIALASADEPSGTSGVIDRSTTYDVVIAPLTGPPIVFTARYGEWVGNVNVYDYLKKDADVLKSMGFVSNPPGTYYLYPSLTFTEGKRVIQTFYQFNCDGIGQYTFIVTYSAYNPSNKWRHMFPDGIELFTTPTQALQSVSEIGFNPLFNVLNRGEQKQNLWHKLVITTKATGSLTVTLTSHSCITDVNNDKIVNILDISAIARRYGTMLSGYSDPLIIYDVYVDFYIDEIDLVVTSWDFGFHVPP